MNCQYFMAMLPTVKCGKKQRQLKPSLCLTFTFYIHTQTLANKQISKSKDRLYSFVYLLRPNSKHFEIFHSKCSSHPQTQKERKRNRFCFLFLIDCYLRAHSAIFNHSYIYANSRTEKESKRHNHNYYH